MGKNVVIICTLDTKGPETAYLRDRIRALGLTTTVVDSGILGEPIGIKRQHMLGPPLMHYKMLAAAEKLWEECAKRSRN